MRKYHSSVMMVNLLVVLSSGWEIVAHSRTSSSVEIKQDSELETSQESSSKEGFGEEEDDSQSSKQRGILDIHSNIGRANKGKKKWYYTMMEGY